MAKVFINEFKNKLAKKINRTQNLSNTDYSSSVKSVKIDYSDFSNKRNQLFVSYISRYLADNISRDSLIKVNPYTVKFMGTPKSNKYGMHSVYYVTLSLISLKDPHQKWECNVHECDDSNDNEIRSNSFNDGELAIEFFLKEIKLILKN